MFTVQRSANKLVNWNANANVVIDIFSTDFVLITIICYSPNVNVDHGNRQSFPSLLFIHCMGARWERNLNSIFSNTFTTEVVVSANFISLIILYLLWDVWLGGLFLMHYCGLRTADCGGKQVLTTIIFTSTVWPLNAILCTNALKSGHVFINAG